MKRNNYEWHQSNPDESVVKTVLDKYQDQGLRDDSHEYFTLDIGEGRVKHIPKRAYIRYEGDRIKLADYIEMIIVERDDNGGE